jgi:hypothetical protein
MALDMTRGWIILASWRRSDVLGAIDWQQRGWMAMISVADMGAAAFEISQPAVRDRKL